MSGIEIHFDSQVVGALFNHRTGVIIGETPIVEDDVALDRRIT
jgi:serine acetyltransferase